MPSLGPSAGPVDELEQETPRPLSLVQDSDGGDGRRRDEVQEKGRSALRARLFATHAASRSSDDSETTKRLQKKQHDQQQEMDALASSLQLSISVGQEATRDTDMLLKSLKICEEERTEERARTLNMRNRLLNAEAKLLVVEQTSSGYKAQLLDKEREAQELRHNLQTAEQAQREMQRDVLRTNSELAQVKRELDQTSRTILSADQEAERLRAAKMSIDQQLQELRRRLTVAEDDAQSRKGALEQQSAECEAFRNEVKELRGKLDESESAQVKVSSSWAAAAGKCEVLLSERAQLEASKQSMAEQNSKLHSQLSEVRGLVEANMWEAETKETALTEAKTAWDTLEGALRGDIRTLQQQLADAKQQLHTARDSTSQVSTELMVAQQQIADYNAQITTASVKAVNALQAAALLKQQQVEELDASLVKANEHYSSERARANELQRERDELLAFELYACAGLQEVLGEVISVKGRLIEESRGLTCLLNDAAADKRALQAQCDAHAVEASAMMLKLQVLWDEKEAAVEGVQLRLRHVEQQWKLSVEREQTATQQKLHRIICRIKNSSLVSGFELWRETAQEQVRLRLKSQKVIMRFKHSCLVSCLELWRETAREQVQMRQEEEAREKKSQKIIYRIKNNCLVSCYDLWRDTAQEQVQTRKKTQRIIFRIKCACLVNCFELWREHHDEMVNDELEQALQETQNALREKLVQRSQKMIKRWLLRSHWTQWREAVIRARDATQDEIRAALEEEVQKSLERARALEKQYAETQASLQRAVQEHEEAERGWEGQQESQYESLVRRSQIFMKRWCMRSHLAIWTQTLVAARQQRLEDNVAKLSAEKASLSAASEEEKLRLVSEQERLRQMAGAECSSLSSEVDTARKEVQRLSGALADLQRQHDDAVREATTSSALSAALGKQTKELSAFAAETSAKLEAAQAQVRRLTSEVEILLTGSQKHEGRAGALHEEMIELKSQHSTLSAQLAAKKVECSRLDIEMSEVRGELESAHAIAKELDEQLSLAREDGEEREGILAELQAQMLPALQAALVEKDISVKWLRAQVEAAQEQQEHSKKEAAAFEVSIAQAWAATKEAREQLLARDATIRQLNVEITDSTSNVKRLAQTESTLREAMQNLKDTVAQLREEEIKAHEMYVNLQARKEEYARRITSLVDENAALQKDKAEMCETSLRDRNEMRSLKHQLGAFEERAKDLDSVVEREQAELNRQRAARKETEKLNTALMERNTELDKFYKEREASAVKALSDQLQKLKDGARKQLEDVKASCEHKSQEAESREREARQVLAQCQVELRRLLDERKSLEVVV
jgi:chromosome segregation ATPase